MTTFKDHLAKLNACGEAVQWVGERTLEQAWAECQCADWMLWLLRKIEFQDRAALVQIACDCAERALRFVPAGEDRPRVAIETARAWVLGKATQEDFLAAANAANAAYVAAAAAYVAAANSAAYATADAAAAYATAAAAAAYATAANSAAYAAVAADADAAANAANAAYVAADADAEHSAQADIVRQYVTAERVAEAMKEVKP